nr:ABC transporter permease [Nitratireductor sp. StC3]
MRRAPPSAWFGMSVLAIYVLVAVLAPLLAPYGESEVFDESFAPWSAQFVFGTDYLGRDVLSRLIYGARNTMAIAVAATTLSFAVGALLGIAAALNQGWFDTVLSRLVDTLMAIPALIFALMLLAIFGSSIPNLILIIALIDSTRVFRLTRSVAMDVAVMDFVEIAHLRREGFVWMLRREILPNVTTPLIAEFGMRYCFVFLGIAALSFLGVGIQPPTADWGSMVRENATLIAYGDLTPMLPAAAIALLTVAINFIVDWLLALSSRLNDAQ